jgi:hypothetical protein
MNTNAINSDSQCPICEKPGVGVPRYRMDGAAWGWCCGLFWTTYLFWLIPVFSNSCNDIELLCDKCGGVKNVTPGKCC